MGYLDYAGLQYLWSKLKEKFAPKSHTHDDRYYTEAEMDGKLNSKVNNNEAGANGLLSKLTTSWTATPTDNTYFIRQDTGGGNSFGRVKFSTLWTYIKSKADGVYQPKGSYAASSHTHDDRYYTESEINTKLSGYLPTSGGTMGGTAKISWPDSGNWSKKNDGVTFPVKRGGLSWTGQSDGIDLYGEETGNDNLDLVLKFTDDNSNSLRIVNASGTTTAKITATGTFTGKASTAGIADTATTATSATTSNCVKDYNDANKTIQIGYAGSGLTASNLNYVAGYTDNGTKIKDVSKEVLTSWIGLGNYLPLSGGIVTGQIKKDTGGSWIGDRDRVLARSHFPGKGSYGAVAGIATTNGFWTMGSLGGDERLIFNYSTDSNYSAGNNSTSQVYLPAQAGTIITSATIGSQSVNYANSAGSVAWGNVSGKPSTFTPASHTHPYLPVAGGTMTGALTFANNTWNPVGDDVQIGDHNTSGSFYIQGLNGATNIKLKKKGDTSTGAGDSATITYDGGNLVIDKTIQANLSGNASTATKATSADKATSASSADKAAKLTTARTVSGGSDITLSFNYDGSGNSTANIGFYSCKHNVDNTNNYPFHRFARLDVNKGAWVDKSITFLISQDYSGGGYGICRLVYRSNADSGSASVDAQWLVRRGFSADTIQVAIKTDKTNGAYCDAFYKSSGTYMGVVIRAIASGGRATSGRTWTLVDSNEVGGTTATDKKTSSECWKTIADAGTALHKQAYSASAPAKDEGYVASAGSANTASIATTGVQDYNASNRTIKIGYAGTGLTKDNLTHVAGYTEDGNKIKDVSKDVLRSWIGLGNVAYKNVRSLSNVGPSGWANQSTDDGYVPTMAFMAFWNGAFSGSGSSNLQYCDRGRFGTIVTKGSGDYAAAGHTHNYAGSGSAGGSANSAVKLDSNAGSSVQPVYFSGGKPVAIGYTISSSVPANAKFTDTTYGVASSSSNGLMSSTDKTKLDDFSRVISIQKQIKLTTDWLDTGIAGNSLDTGTYVVQVSGFNSSYTQLYSEIYSGVMSWYSGTTNSGNSSEIFLHNAGLADNNNAIYLRTLRVAGSKTLKLQIACKVAATGTDILTFKFRRLI